MAISVEPSVILSHLHRADGSATYAHNGYTIIGAVNGPIEVLRRDELPEEAALEVAIRPATGPGAIRERHLETVVQSALRQIIQIQDFPRTLIQITLQIIRVPEDDSKFRSAQSESMLPVLCALLQTAVLALLSASMPMTKVLSSVILALHSSGGADQYILHPDARQVQAADSVHMLAFSSGGELLLNESEGPFTLEQWEQVYDRAQQACGGEQASVQSLEDMQDTFDERTPSMLSFVKSAMQEKVTADLAWKPDKR